MTPSLRSVAAAASLWICWTRMTPSAHGFASPLSQQPRSSGALASSATGDDFSAFAASLEEEEPKADLPPKWQMALEELLDPSTDLGRRQVLLNDVVQSNQEIRQAVQDALRERNIDPLLTPRGKRLQDGTRAVARQLTNDILPTLAQQARSPPTVPSFQQFNTIGNRVLSALSNQAKQNLETLERDLRDPRRIPMRLSRQTEDLVKEATNVFAETPVGLAEPPYTVVATTDQYELRDYPAYTVVTTSLGDDTADVASWTKSGSAFQRLAAYIFGANQQEQVLSMTTPVQTTMSGEMRFYLDKDRPPQPLVQDQGKSVYEADHLVLQTLPASRLAVRRFAGFATDGEIRRQKQALLAALTMDDIALDVEHGQTVGHVVFEYNPPYTLPVVRRNEIAVPVLDKAAEEIDWTTGESTWEDDVPSA